MKANRIFTAAIAALALTAGSTAIHAQEPIGGVMGPGPVISAPGSPSGLGSPNANFPANPAANPQTNPSVVPPGGPGLQINNGPAPAPGSDIYNPGPPTGEPPLAGPGPAPLAPMVVEEPLSTPNWQNAGTTTVIACGTDAQGVWQTIPLRVSYQYNGAQYNVTVDSAWNPWTDDWNYGIDVPAFNTYYFLNGNYYDFYLNLSTGTFYFNL